MKWIASPPANDNNAAALAQAVIAIQDLPDSVLMPGEVRAAEKVLESINKWREYGTWMPDVLAAARRNKIDQQEANRRYARAQQAQRTADRWTDMRYHNDSPDTDASGNCWTDADPGL